MNLLPLFPKTLTLTNGGDYACHPPRGIYSARTSCSVLLVRHCIWGERMVRGGVRLEDRTLWLKLIERRTQGRRPPAGRCRLTSSVAETRNARRSAPLSCRHWASAPTRCRTRSSSTDCERGGGPVVGDLGGAGLSAAAIAGIAIAAAAVTAGAAGGWYLARRWQRARSDELEQPYQRQAEQTEFCCVRQ